MSAAHPASEGPEVLDVAALASDDALVEQLAAGAIAPTPVPPSARGTEDELVAMLAAWVADVRPEALASAETRRLRENR
jgi:hypothetical protein